MTTNNLGEIINDRESRRNLAFRSHYYFFHMYFSHYIKHETADLHREMFGLTEDSGVKNIVIVAFRGSAKSTLMALSYPIWAMVGKPGKKFIVIISQTQQQARLILANIKRELERNKLLISDFGPFVQSDDEWRANSLVISKYQTRITAISSGESIRGLRHLESRPDLIILDDIEDLESVKTRESRNKTFNWLTGDVIPAGSDKTKLVIVGNLLHEDSLIKRLEKQIREGKFDAEFRAYPLIDKETDEILWPGRYPDMDAVNKLRQKVPSEAAWQREYLLNIVSDAERVVHPEWIKTYDELPEEEPRYIASGVDIAISKKQSADKTAVVSTYVYGYGEEKAIYILENPINERFSFPETVDSIKRHNRAIEFGSEPITYVEDVGIQKSLVQQLEEEGEYAEGVKIGRQDKRARLALTTRLIRQGKILFPKTGAEELIEQLTGFGVERYDDLADAFSILILKIMEDDEGEIDVIVVGAPFPTRGLYNKNF